MLTAHSSEHRGVRQRSPTVSPTVLSHAIWSTSHLNWTNPRTCLTQSGPHSAAARANAGDVGATCPVGVSWPPSGRVWTRRLPTAGDEPAEAGVGRRIP